MPPPVVILLLVVNHSPTYTDYLLMLHLTIVLFAVGQKNTQLVIEQQPTAGQSMMDGKEFPFG